MRTGTARDYRERIDEVIEAISLDVAASHSLESLAAIANFSPYHFHRIYKAMQHECVADTIRRLRLSRGAYQLASSSLTVAEIAMEVGYESGQAFARAFRELTRMSPTEYRESRLNFADVVPGPPIPLQKEYPVNVTIKEQAPFQAHFLHKRTEEEIPETYRRLWQWVVTKGHVGQVDYTVGLCFDDPEQEDSFQYFAGVVFRGDIPASDEIQIRDVPGGSYAAYRHIGPYSGISDSFQQMFGTWLPASGYEVDDRPALEIYLNDPMSTPANLLETDLLIPVKSSESQKGQLVSSQASN